MDTLPLSCDSRSAAFRFNAGYVVFDTSYSRLIIREQGLVACDGDSDPVSEEVELELSAWDSTALTAHFRRVRAHPCKPGTTPPDTLEATGRVKRCAEAPVPMCG